MKYAIIIPDGAADLPVAELDDRTPFEAAATPNLDRVAMLGRIGTAVTTPDGFGAGSDVCSMSLLGYDPGVYHTGRAPLEAAALGIETGPDDYIFRVNLVTTGLPGADDEGLMLDHSAGHITDDEAQTLIKDLVDRWREQLPTETEHLALTPGVSYRNILVDSSGRSYAKVKTTPPHEIPGLPWAKHMPEGSGGGREEAKLLARLMEISAEFLPEHPVNKARLAAGKRPATMAWIWGQGVRPTVPSFHDRFGLRGAMITAVDLLAGIASFIGWDRLDVPGMTSYHDTDYAAQGAATCEALDAYDVVCCHVEAPDEASHQADWQTKVASIEAIDRHVVGPILEKLQTFGDPEQEPAAEGWRLLVLPDHYTLVGTRLHDPTPVPFAMAGAWVRSVVKRPFTEAEADESDLHIDPGHDLMEYFLKGGLARVRAPSGKSG